MQTQVTYRPHLKGHLEVHTFFDSEGNQVGEAFAFASLADVLGVPLSTLEGRYARSNAKVKKINLRTGAGRPARGFPMELLDAVIAAMTSVDAKFAAPADTPRGVAQPKPLVPEMFNGLPHYTVQALADHFGVAVQTVRNRIKSSGLDAIMVPLGASPQGGRPRMAFRAEDLPRIQWMMGSTTYAPPAPPASVVPIASAPRLTVPAQHSTPTNQTGVCDPAVVRLMADVEQILADFQLPPAKEPAPVVETDIQPIDRYDVPVFIPAKSESHWRELVAQTALRHITMRWSPDTSDYAGCVISLNGQGESLGLQVTPAQYGEYVGAMRDRVRVHLRPYEEALVRFVEEMAPEGGEPKSLAYMYALRRAIYHAPVYNGQVPSELVHERGRRRSATAQWDLLTGKGRASKEARARAVESMTDSSAYREHFAQLMDKLHAALAAADAEYGVGVTLDPAVQGYLKVDKPGVILPYAA